MNSLETAKERLDLLIKKQDEVFLALKKNYGLDDEECEDAESIQEAICQEDIMLEWDEKRDVDYADDAVRCQQMLVSALECLENGDKKSVHNGNKSLETLLREARRIKKEKEEDVKKAQEVISLMNDIMDVCNKNHK